MAMPILIELENDVRDELEAQAHARGIGLPMLLRDLATNAAREARRARIRQGSESVAAHVAASPEARDFYLECGSPQTDGG